MKLGMYGALFLSLLSFSSALPYTPQPDLGELDVRGVYAINSNGPNGSTQVAKVDFFKLLKILEDLEGYNKKLLVRVNEIQVDIKNAQNPNQSSWPGRWLLIACAGVGLVAFLGGRLSAQRAGGTEAYDSATPRQS